MPQKLNLNYLDSIVQELEEFYQSEKEKIIQEARQAILAKTMNEFRNARSECAYLLGQRVEGVCGIIISWFKYYYKSYFCLLQNKLIVD